MSTPKVITPPFTVIIDQREKLPFPLVGFATKSGFLKTGDYSLEGYENQVACERKSYGDMWTSMSTNRARFERCVQRLAELDRAAIVVECTMKELAVQPSYVERVSPASVVGGLISWSVRYRLPIFFCDDRAHAERVTVRFLAAYWKHIAQAAGECCGKGPYAY